EESLLATERELLRADSLAPGIRGQRLIVIDVVEGRKTLESEPFFVGMGREPTISPDGKWVLYSGSLLPFNSGEMPHGGEGLHLIEVATGSMKRLTPPDIQSYQGCWFPDSQRYFVRIYDSPDSRSTDRIAIGDLNGTLTPWKEVQPLVQLVQVILAADVASAWNPNQDRFIAATMAGRDGNQSGERMEFLELNRVSIPDASHSVVAEIPFKSSLVRGRFRSLAWLFPSAAPSGD
ncbi:MAG: hypothetical protein KF858_07065, partial [Candidatus Sumerlaeia bacterium]|nr:hypothetical protein [Candidatus Sumerlaeia bacterium]